jgi:integrase/recombinase XerD
VHEVVRLERTDVERAFRESFLTAFINQGYSKETARLNGTKLIGHNQEDVTKIYLAEN